MNSRIAVRRIREVAAWFLFQGVLFTLPWVGLGVVRAVSGVELGTGLQPAWLLLGLVVILQAPELLRFLRTTWRSWLPASGPLLVALALSLAGLWLAPSGELLPTALGRFAKQIIQVGIMLVFVLVPAYYLVGGRTLASLARPIVWGAIFELCYGAAQGIHFYTHLGWLAGLEGLFTSNPAILAGSEQLYLNNLLQQVPRLRGTACEPLYLGSFLLLALPLVWVTGWPRWRRVAVTLLLGLLLGATWSRGAWLAAVAGAVFGVVVALRAGLFQWRSLSKRWIWGVTAVILLGVVFARQEMGLPWQRLVQTFSTLDWSNLTRLYSMQAAWRAFLLSPVVGVGWGQFAFHFATLVDPMGLQSMFSWPVVNNFPLEILCEVGLLGGVGLVWLATWLWRRCWRFLLRAAAPGRGALVLLVASVGAIWLQLLTFSQYNLPHIWVTLGLVVGILATPGRVPE